MKLTAVLCFVLIISLAFHAAAEELPPGAQRILDDLGAPEVQQQNNGKTVRCIFGGTKKITISLLEGATIFSGEYYNCRESGSTRDGYFEYMVRDGEVIGESSRRSVNGELFDAVRSGDMAKVKALIRKKADVNYAEPVRNSGGATLDGWTPLMSAVITENAEMVKLLVKAGAWVNYMNSSAISALWLSANNGNLEITRYLIAHGAYLDNSNIENVTPLMAAAINGHTPVVKYLLAAKAAVNMTHKDGDSALMSALANKHTEAAQLLIDAGADINIRNRYGVTALLIAVAESNEAVVRTLLQHKVDLTVRTDNGKDVMDIASAKGNENIIRMLKKAHAAVE